ncbi:ABC transporter, ATP-binding protein [Peptostreptococcaceae bacterium oral taxon 113 str. W5053]|nr:ABC transporter, ATP-binding protein [Peptostreptococcaceae bacterium oral taxon 113 str. W5053]
MLKVEHISKTFQTDKGEVKAVRDVSFEVADGEIYGLIGLSGAGKSTVVRCLNLLERPEEGTIYFNGENLASLPDRELRKRRKDIGMIFQHFNLFEQKNVFENIAFPLRRLRMNSTEIKKRADELLQYIDLEEKREAYPSELSGGQKQRVAIARALATNPKLILSDEGTSALDPETTQSILTLLKDSVKKFGVSIVMITHQMEVAKEICDRIGVMEGGEIIEEGTVEELFLHPKEKRTFKFIQKLRDEVEDISVDAYEGKLYRLSFDNVNVSTPVISHLSRLFDVDINILAGNMNALRSGQVGYLIIEFLGAEEEKDKAIAYLGEQGVYVEAM